MENKTRNSFTYTQPYDESHVSADLSAMALMFIEMLCKLQEQSKPYGELIATKDALAKFGFDNSQNAKLLGPMKTQMAKYTEATKQLAFMEEVWKLFGKDAMVIRYDHFLQILEKYDMVCGSFDRYTGGIPQEALDTLSRLNGMWVRKELKSKYASGVSYTDWYEMGGVDEWRVDVLRKHIRMPLRTDDEAICSAIGDATHTSISLRPGEVNRETLTDVLFIAAPAADMKPLEIVIHFDTDRLKELRSVEPSVEKELRQAEWKADALLYARLDTDEKLEIFKNRDRLRVIRDEELEAINQAVKDEEKRLEGLLAATDINRYAKISFIHKEAEIVRVIKDPFICSLTPYGVLIHAKWGAEAENATIKRYEQLRDSIMGGEK